MADPSIRSQSEEGPRSAGPVRNGQGLVGGPRTAQPLRGPDTGGGGTALGGPKGAPRRPPDRPKQTPGPSVRASAMDAGRAGRLGTTEAAPCAPPPFAHVAPSLFLGNARAAAAPEPLARAGVTLCVNVSRQQPGPRAPGVAELRVPVFDDPAEDLLAHLEATCAAMEDAVRAGGACLVYCKNGRSRSAAVCTAYLMRHRGLSLAQAFQAVKSARPVAEPNPGFWSQLQKYEEALQSRPRPCPGSPRD